jgi:hypothetical protein
LAAGPRAGTASTFDAEAATQPPTTPETDGPGAAPEAINGYQLIRPLGKGGMGTVYEAEEAASGRRVALKLIGAEFVSSKDAVERFRQEGRLASMIAHPRCVFVLAADEDAGRPFLVMELMPGETLKDLVDQQGPLPVEQAVVKILDVIEGLQAVHRFGLIHRDIKPSNCFLEADGRVKIGDFGLSKSLLKDAHLTRTGTFMGTPLFASPEQVRGERADQQSDVYSVAATLYYLLTGRAPFQSGDAAVTLARIAADPAPPMRSIRPDLPAGLDEIVLRGLDRDRQRRWKSLEEMRQALLPFAPGQLTAGGLGLRFAAVILDVLILSPLSLAQAFLGLAGQTKPELRLAYNMSLLASVVISFLYASLQEGIWGCTPGKRCFRLRVSRVQSSEPPGLGRASLRTLLYYAFLSGPLIVQFFQPPPHEVWLTLIYDGTILVLFALGILLIVGPMRAHNGYRGLHELLSGTRVIRLPELPRHWTADPFSLSLQAEPISQLPQRLGNFAVRGAFPGNAGLRVLLGEDPVLGRAVLIELRALDAAPLTPGRRAITRPTRLRWLSGGTDHQGQWDAFLAPSSAPLPDLVATSGRLSWTEVRPLLEQLTNELVAACADGTLPDELSLEQVCVRADGGLQLLDTSLRTPPPLGAAGRGASAPAERRSLSPEERALELLRQVAVHALEGASPSADSGMPPRVPLPEHAVGVLAPLFRNEETYPSVKEFQKALANTHDRPTQVTRVRRAAHLAAVGLLIGLGFSCCVMSVGCMQGYGPMVGLSVHCNNAEEALSDLDKVMLHEFVSWLANPIPWLRLRAAELDSDLRLRRQLEETLENYQREKRERLQTSSWLMQPVYDLQEDLVNHFRITQVRDPSRAWNQPFGARWWAAFHAQRSVLLLPTTGLLLVLNLAPVVWVLWAFLTHGGLSFRVMGLSLVRSDGRKASRTRCAWRAFLVWIPVFALLSVAVWLDQAYWEVWWYRTPPLRWILWISWSLWWLGLLLLPLYCALALWFPTRSLHDRLAGTYLVPR